MFKIEQGKYFNVEIEILDSGNIGENIGIYL